MSAAGIGWGGCSTVTMRSVDAMTSGMLRNCGERKANEAVPNQALLEKIATGDIREIADHQIDLPPLQCSRHVPVVASRPNGRRQMVLRTPGGRLAPAQ